MWREHGGASVVSDIDSSNLVQRDFLPYIDESLATQDALLQLGVNSSVEPIDIPGIDHYHVRKELVAQLPPDFIIDVIGMPNTGKSTLVGDFGDWLQDRNNRWSVSYIEEVARGFARTNGSEAKLMFHENTKEAAYRAVVGRQYHTDPNYMACPQPKQPNLMVRGIVDRVIWQRIYFATGDIPQIAFAEGYKYYNSRLSEAPITLPVGAVIFMFASPQISLERDKPRTEPSHVMNEPFLTKLYEQYLRLYQELQSGEFTNGDITEVNTPVPIVIGLDMEDDPEVCAGKFNDAMSYILSTTRTRSIEGKYSLI